MKIAIAGTGYVGLSSAMLLAQHNEVVAVDIIVEKFSLLSNSSTDCQCLIRRLFTEQEFKLPQLLIKKLVIKKLLMKMQAT